jgi:hypothetical protein
MCSGCNRPLRRVEPKRLAVHVHAIAEPLRAPSPHPAPVVDPGAARRDRTNAPEPRDRGAGRDTDVPNTRRVTVFDPGAAVRAGELHEDETGPRNQPPAPTRKIVGILVTYSWTDAGQIFPILEGRNRIGRDPSQCDIAIPQDDTLSAINSHIVFRRNFTIGDEVSMCGTDVDGDPIETPFVPLRNYARIRTGSTLWTFISIEPPAAESAEAAKETRRT